MDNIVHQPLRYAHDEGHTDICFSEAGDKFITCGADGDIRIWSTDDTEDPIHTCIGEWALSVRQNGDKLYVATGSNDIQILSMPGGERDGVLHRFTAPINHIAIGKNKDLVALAAEDMEIKLIKLLNENDNKDMKIIEGSEGPCLAVALSSNSKYLATSSGDCKLRIYDIETLSLLKEIKCFPKVNSFSNAKVLSRIDFDPSGQNLAYPDNNTVIVLHSKDWEQSTSLTCDDVTAPLSIVQWSPCSRYILATSTEGDFVIWDRGSKSVVGVSKHEKSISICGLMWNPKGNGEIVYTDIEGQLGIMSGCIAKGHATNSDNKTNATKIQPSTTDDDVRIDENGFMENDVNFDDVEFEDNDDDDDNENAVSVEKIKKQYAGSPEPELESLGKGGRSRSPTPRPRTPETPLQSAFMPSSTPAHLDPRYLCWNHVGIVRCYGNNSDDSDSATAAKSIEVDFHDTTFHNSIMVNNYHDYTMASLSQAALAVANANQLHVIPLNNASKEWSLKTNEFEEILLIATSDNLICMATSQYLLRICSIFGTQRAVVSLPGPPITINAFNNSILVAYHSGAVRKGEQCINVRLITIEGLSIDSKDLGAALGPEATISWLGFSENGTPGVFDSLGMLYLYPASCNAWFPFCDTAKHMKSLSDGFFVTAIFETYQAVGGIKCKGSVYPGFVPRPTICELQLEPPFCEGDTEKCQFETTLFTSATLQIADKEKKFKEAALKAFALAAKNDLDQRAIELMEILGNQQILNLGTKYATKLQKRRLADKLIELAMKLQESSDAEEIPVDEYRPKKGENRPAAPTRSTNFAVKSNSQKNGKPSGPVPNTQESLFSEKDNSISDKTSNISIANDSLNSTGPIPTPSATPAKKNPFLKSLKKPKLIYKNPLSLVDKNQPMEGKLNMESSGKTDEITGEKRKLADNSESTIQKPKQRKLDTFMKK